ncbi:MAG: hypothetical protein K1W17_06815 [Oscillospiraceae bacterium]
MAPSHAGTRLPIAVIIRAEAGYIGTKGAPLPSARSCRDSNYVGDTVLHFLSKE